MINADTEQESVPPSEAGQVDASRRRRRLWWWVAGGVVALLVLVGVGSALVQVPYYAIAPGSVYGTDDLVEVAGTEQYDTEGQIGFTTVSLRRATALEAALGWLDPAVELVPEEQILGDQSADENREVQLRFMADSKTSATAVALAALGYDVVSGDGADVLEVDPDLPAADVLEVGDVVREIDGEPIELWEDMVAVIGARRPGDEISITVERADSGTTEVVTAVLGARDEDQSLPILGVVGQTHDMSFDFPFDIEIDSGEVGGPSAGLAFSLAVLEKLTPEDLTGGNYVATTGTINLDGTVGPVGGVAQKTIAARRAGVDVFVVPGVEYDEALEVAGDMRVEKADTIEEALAVLDSAGGDTLALGAGNEAASGG